MRPRRVRSLLGIVVLAVMAMAQAPFCPAGGTPTPTATSKAASPAATKAATSVATAPTTPKAGATGAATPATTATAATKAAAGGASVGWIHPKTADEAKTLSIAPPYRSVALACGSGLPAGAKVQLRLSGEAGAAPTAEGTVGSDGKLEVRVPIQRPGTVSFEYASITPTSGAAPSPLPAGGSGTVTLPDNKAC